MKKLTNLLVAMSVSLVVYILAVKFTGSAIIDFGFAKAKAGSGLMLATFLMLTAIFIRLSIKKKESFIIGDISKRRILLWSSFVVITGLSIGLLSFFLVTSARKLSEQEVIRRFNQIYEKSNNIKWLGVDSWQNPCDNWMMQEIIYDTKPDFIIETGTAQGGTTLFYATVLEQVNKNGQIITVDIQPQVEEASKFKIFQERVEIIEGNSVSPEVINAINKRVKDHHKVLVVLDSLHTKEHVLKELNLYSKFVSLNSYIVVQDTRFDIIFSPDLNPGPRGAVEEFLKTNKSFKIDHSREKFLLTNYPSGFLKRIK